MAEEDPPPCNFVAIDDEGGDGDSMTFVATPPMPSTSDSGYAWGFLLCICMRMALVWAFRSSLIDALVPRILLTGFTFVVSGAWVALWLTKSPWEWGLLGHAWWHYMRPIHATTYVTAGIMGLHPNFRAHAWLPLGADVLIAAVAWLVHHMNHE